MAACAAISKSGKLVFSMFSPRGVRPRRKPVPISVYQKFTLLSTNVKITLPSNQQGDKFALLCQYTAAEPAAVQTLIFPPWVWHQNFSKFCLYLFLTCVFTGVARRFGGVHAVDYVCLQ
jgi:hypothetical protein